VDIDAGSLPPLTTDTAELEKRREQALGQKPKHRHPSAIAVLAGVLKRDGVRGWYQVSEHFHILIFIRAFVSPSFGYIES
jgi:hypothetical protein